MITDLIIAVTNVISMIAVFLLFGLALDYEIKYRKSGCWFIFIGITAGVLIWLIVN